MNKQRFKRLTNAELILGEKWVLVRTIDREKLQRLTRIGAAPERKVKVWFKRFQRQQSPSVAANLTFKQYLCDHHHWIVDYSGQVYDW
jgi:hypothetical protein